MLARYGAHLFFVPSMKNVSRGVTPFIGLSTPGTSRWCSFRSTLLSRSPCSQISFISIIPPNEMTLQPLDNFISMLSKRLGDVLGTTRHGAILHKERESTPSDGSFQIKRKK
ncbi:hypothetical protein L2E82_31302 [Cichorium intybus]|uniref:Uncharacterized protein n=1 Tax=Cichorium intybus TaxID=13427 RepID=A0ACB9D2H4_CICIN|nr:hypothetical protein L2E82_31302 [Cichorium intybus]